MMKHVLLCHSMSFDMIKMFLRREEYCDNSSNDDNGNNDDVLTNVKKAVQVT